MFVLSLSFLKIHSATKSSNPFSSIQSELLSPPPPEAISLIIICLLLHYSSSLWLWISFSWKTLTAPIRWQTDALFQRFHFILLFLDNWSGRTESVLETLKIHLSVNSWITQKLLNRFSLNLYERVSCGPRKNPVTFGAGSTKEAEEVLQHIYQEVSD